MFNFSKLIREIRVMAEKLSTWKFILIWLVFAIMASGYFIGQIRWW
ncbi:putative bacteriophage protein [Escherichia coli TA249]|nr:putative bacteriophage protein [Escherichia coli TA249]